MSAPKRLLMVVECTFDWQGKTLLAPGVTADDFDRGLLGVGVRVVRPDGTTFDTSIVAVGCVTPNHARRYPVGLQSSSLEQPVPSGSEIWTHGCD